MRRMTRWTLGGLAVIVAVGGTLTIVGVDSTAAPDDQSDTTASDARSAPRAVLVETAVLERATRAARLRTVGSVVARDRSHVAAERAGRVDEIMVADGARVEADESLIRFEDSAERAEVRAAEAELEERRLDLERARTLAEKEVLSRSLLEDRRVAFTRAEARLTAARSALDDRLLRAPFAGRIGRVEVSPGAVVAVGQRLVELTTTTAPRVRFAVPAAIAAGLTPGDRVGVSFEDGDAGIEAEIELVEQTARASDRLVEIEASLGDAGPGSIPGRLVTVDVPRRAAGEALWVPETAVLWAGPQAYLFRIDDEGRARRRAITVGTRRGGRVAVEGEGLAAGDRVVALGLQKLRDGARVATREGAVEPGRVVARDGADR